jgi:hypothetical protein
MQEREGRLCHCTDENWQESQVKMQYSQMVGAPETTNQATGGEITRHGPQSNVLELATVRIEDAFGSLGES